MPNAPMYAIASAGIPAVKDMSGEWLAFMGINRQRDALQVYDSIQAYGKAPADETWVYRCMSIKARAAQSVPLKVWVKSRNDHGSFDRVDALVSGNTAAQDLAYLLDNVNPESMTGADLKAYTQAAIDIWGENYVRKVRGRFGGPPQELWWLRAPDTTPNLGATWIDSYTYAPTWNPDYSTRTTYPAKDVIALRRINLQNPARGLSALASVRYHISVLQQSAVQTASTIFNDSVPPGAWVVQKGEEVTNQDENALKRMLRALKGPSNRGKVPVITAPVQWQQLAMNPSDAEYIAGQKLSRMAVCAAFGVPLVMAGDDERTTVYHNMRDAERIFWRASMIPDLDWIADSYNNWLVPDFDPKRQTLEVAFDYSGIEALQDPASTQKTVALNEVRVGARTINEYRKDFEVGGGEPVSWGNEPPASPQQDLPVPSPEVDGDVSHADTAEPATRELDLLREGLRRRYSAKQLLEGVPAENFPGLRSLTHV